MIFPISPLKRLVDPNRPITYGIVQAGEHVSDGIPYIRPVDMDAQGGVDPEALLRTSREIAAAYRRSALRAGDVVVSIGPSFGKTMLVPEQLEGANLTQGTARVAVRNGASRRFVLWALQAKTSTAHWESSVGGATFRALNLGPLAETPVPCPALELQDQIAGYLDRETAEIDAFIAELRAANSLISERRQAAVNIAMAIGSARPLRRTLATSITGPFGTLLSATEYVKGGIPLINPVNIRANRIVVDPAASVTNAKAADLSRYRLRQGDVILARKGDVSKAALVGPSEAGFICGSDAIALRPGDDTRPEFLWWQLQSRAVQQQLEAWSVGSTVAGLNQDIMAKVMLRIPHRDEQAQAAERAARAAALHDLEMADIDAAIALAKERRAALITAAVTGQIDVTTRQEPVVDSVQQSLAEVR